MAKVLIVYYSRTGHTEKMADTIEEAIRQEGLEVVKKKAEETNVDELLGFDGIIIGSPTYYGTMAWPIKKLIDESVKFHGRLSGKVGAAFSSSANIAGGNETVILSILEALLIHGMIVQGEPKGDHYGPVAINEPDERALKGCKRLGQSVANLVKRLEAVR
ncbi:MAG: flavodoxin domain-containing protein [Candidatus Omnitrophota bacterium]|nr:flavodoxin domain-containing protein [Candidatus Omnitrophota bacterium]